MDFCLSDILKHMRQKRPIDTADNGGTAENPETAGYNESEEIIRAFPDADSEWRKNIW